MDKMGCMFCINLFSQSFPGLLYSTCLVNKKIFVWSMFVYLFLDSCSWFSNATFYGYSKFYTICVDFFIMLLTIGEFKWRMMNNLELLYEYWSFPTWYSLFFSFPFPLVSYKMNSNSITFFIYGFVLTFHLS